MPLLGDLRSAEESESSYLGPPFAAAVMCDAFPLIVESSEPLSEGPDVHLWQSGFAHLCPARSDKIRLVCKENSSRPRLVEERLGLLTLDIVCYGIVDSLNGVLVNSRQ